MRRQALVLDSEDLLPAAGARWSGRGAGNQSGAVGGANSQRGRGAWGAFLSSLQSCKTLLWYEEQRAVWQE